MKRKNRNRIGRVISILFALILAIGVPLTVMAADRPDPEQMGSITVHKYETDYQSVTPGSGLEITDEETLSKLGVPMEGVGFTLYRIDAAFELTETTTPEEALAHIDYTYPEQFTDENGEVYFGQLDSVRYYVLVETTPPQGDYRAMEPAIISVPYGYTGSGEGWNYDIHVYPKNIDEEEVDKEVEDEQQKYFVGDTVSWLITGYVNPEIRAGESAPYTYGYYRFVDALDQRLTYTDGSETILAPLAGGGSIALTAVSDYTVTLDEPSNTLTFTFTPAGIDKLIDGGAVRIEIRFDTVINSLATGDESIKDGEDQTTIINSVIKEWENLETSEEKEATPDVDPSIKLAYIEILKVDNEFNDIFLDGAAFKIATSLDNANAGVFIKDSTGADLVATTGADGRSGGLEHGFAIITGLAAVDGAAKEYFLVEVRTPDAPAGHADWEYVLRPDVIKVTIPEDAVSASVTIKNTRLGEDGEGPIFKLPFTGGQGTGIFWIAGGILLAAGILIFVLGRRKMRRRR